jgi:AcrR family transcriptional regulator
MPEPAVSSGQIPASRTGARERLIETAIRLFAESGVRATGIDRILAEAGVAKMSLYKHFRSKDELVLGALRRKDELFRETFVAMVGSRTDPRARLLGVFDALERWFRRPDFRGCLFLNVASEHPDPDCPVRRAVAEHKAWVRARLLELARDTGTPDPDTLAERLMLLFEGAIARAYVTGDPGVARQARAAAEAWLDREALA